MLSAKDLPTCRIDPAAAGSLNSLHPIELGYFDGENQVFPD